MKVELNCCFRPSRCYDTFQIFWGKWREKGEKKTESEIKQEKQEKLNFLVISFFFCPLWRKKKNLKRMNMKECCVFHSEMETIFVLLLSLECRVLDGKLLSYTDFNSVFKRSMCRVFNELIIWEFSLLCMTYVCTNKWTKLLDSYSRYNLNCNICTFISEVQTAMIISNTWKCFCRAFIGSNYISTAFYDGLQGKTPKVNKKFKNLRVIIAIDRFIAIKLESHR